MARLRLRKTLVRLQAFEIIDPIATRQVERNQGHDHLHIQPAPPPAARRPKRQQIAPVLTVEKHEMKRLARITIAAIVGLQAIFWIAVVLWLNLTPQVTQNSQQTGAGNIIAVEMNDKLRFVPTKITIKAGDTVEWWNIGSIPHTVTADPGRAPSSRNIELPAGAETFDSGWVKGGQWFRYTFSDPGVYRYICLPHERARMLGTVIVG